MYPDGSRRMRNLQQTWTEPGTKPYPWSKPVVELSTWTQAQPTQLTLKCTNEKEILMLVCHWDFVVVLLHSILMATVDWYKIFLKFLIGTLVHGVFHLKRWWRKNSGRIQSKPNCEQCFPLERGLGKGVWGMGEWKGITCFLFCLLWLSLNFNNKHCAVLKSTHF